LTPKRFSEKSRIKREKKPRGVWGGGSTINKRGEEERTGTGTTWDNSPKQTRNTELSKKRG